LEAVDFVFHITVNVLFFSIHILPRNFISFNHATFCRTEHKMNMQFKEYLTKFQDTLNIWERDLGVGFSKVIIFHVL